MDAQHGTPSPPRGLFSWRDDMRRLEDRLSNVEGNYLKAGDFRTLKNDIEKLSSKIDMVARVVDEHSDWIIGSANLSARA